MFSGSFILLLRLVTTPEKSTQRLTRSLKVVNIHDYPHEYVCFLRVITIISVVLFFISLNARDDFHLVPF